ncbi:MAG: hypothetical protein ABL956_05145 [Hyphomonadaceae bacterium]
MAASRYEYAREAFDLAGAFVDGLLNAVFGGGDLALEAHAAVGAGFEMLKPVGRGEVFE